MQSKAKNSWVSILLLAIGLLFAGLVITRTIQATRQLSDTYLWLSHANPSQDLRATVYYNDDLYAVLGFGIETNAEDPAAAEQISSFLISSMQLIDERILSASVIYTMLLTALTALFLYECSGRNALRHTAAVICFSLIVCILLMAIPPFISASQGIPFYFPKGEALFVLLVSRRGMSKIVTNILGSILATSLSVVFMNIGFGEHPGNMIIGSLIPLIPGVPFTNGIRDLANEDYIAGSTRMIDALTVFFCIAAGVALTFLVDGRIEKGIIVLNGMQTSAETAGWLIQAVSAFLGTVGFAVLYGVPRREYIHAGICSTIGWMAYLVMLRLANATVIESTFVATLVVVLVSRFMAVDRKCPVIVFQICGVFPLIPGAGIFWTVYYIVNKELSVALTTGFTALGMAVAIVLGIIFMTSLPGRMFKIARKKA